ncbi:MAG: helix-turn-helix domain-containing protein [Nitrospira sp.]
MTMNNPIPSHYWDVQALSAYLNVKPGTLYAWAAQGRIPCVKLHGLVRFRRDEVERWVESFRVQEPFVTPKGTPRDPKTALDELIARAKGHVYNSRLRGNQTQSGPIGKETIDGAM